MGSRPFHLARAGHHLEVAEHLAAREEYVDWAVVALFYAAHQWVHSALSGEAELSKDERHPRKHTGGPGPEQGGRGTNQVVAALYPRDVTEAYRSLYELSRRTRYDMGRLVPDQTVYRLPRLQYASVQQFCEHLNAGRPDISTQRP